MTEQPKNSRPKQFMDFAPRARSIDGMRRPSADASKKPVQGPAQKPAARPAMNAMKPTVTPTIRRTTTVKTKTHEATVLVPKAPLKPVVKDLDESTPVRPVIKDRDEPTPVTVKSETVSVTSTFSEEADIIEVEDDLRRPSRHGIIAQLEESSDFGLLGDNIVETKEPSKSVFINTDKVAKRPLGAASSGSPVTPLKNFYKKPAPKPIKDNVPTVVTAAPDKKNSITLIIAGLLTVVLGGIVGTFIYLVFFQ